MQLHFLELLIFFPFVTIIYFLIPHAYRWFWLLVASCYFYASFSGLYLLVLMAVIIIDYFVALIMGRVGEKFRHYFLLIGIISNLSFLFIFKYHDFFAQNINLLASAIGSMYRMPGYSLLLPIGLSFHVFQSISYLIEVYRRKFSAEKHLGIYALYVMFFPQLVAGPIERPQNLLPQFREEHNWNWDRISSGLILIFSGLVKKIVIADRLAVFVNAIYADTAGHSNVDLLLASYFFTIQIFCDFSGYTDIARGAAKVLGFNLMENFKNPYFSTSVIEFWRRWHISLSSWFRDYIYIPLGGSKNGEVSHFSNIMIVFLLSGLWHGANWTFLVWGLLHGIIIWGYLLFAKIALKFNNVNLLKKNPFFYKLLSIALTFNLVNLCFIFFRSQSVTQAVDFCRRILSFDTMGKIFLVNIYSFELLALIILTILFFFSQISLVQKKINDWFLNRQRVVRWALIGVALVILSISMALNSSAPQNFIYFQF